MHGLMHVRQACAINSRAENHKLFLVEARGEILVLSKNAIFVGG